MTSVPCTRCTKGSWLGPNGIWFRCAFCRGTGKVQTEEAPS